MSYSARGIETKKIYQQYESQTYVEFPREKKKYLKNSLLHRKLTKVLIKLYQ